jgi:hypothetical protein
MSLRRRDDAIKRNSDVPNIASDQSIIGIRDDHSLALPANSFQSRWDLRVRSECGDGFNDAGAVLWPALEAKLPHRLLEAAAQDLIIGPELSYNLLKPKVVELFKKRRGVDPSSTDPRVFRVAS